MEVAISLLQDAVQQLTNVGEYEKARDLLYTLHTWSRKEDE